MNMRRETKRRRNRIIIVVLPWCYDIF